MIASCPCCGQAVSEAIPLEQLATSVSGRVRLAIMDTLIKNIGKWTTSSRLVQAVYQDANEEPEYADNTMRVTIHHMRPIIRQYGWEIVAVRGDGKGYQLRPVRDA